MTWRKLLPTAVLAALLIVLLQSITAGAAPAGAASAVRHVRIPAGVVQDAAALGLAPQIAVDYGAFQWLALNETDYRRLAASGIVFHDAPDAGRLQVNAFSFDPLVDGEPALSAAQRDTAAGSGFRLVQLIGPTSDAWLVELEAAGLRLLQYYPNNAYLVWADDAALGRSAALSFVRWQGRFHPAYKPDPTLLQREGRIRNVDVMFYNDGDIAGTVTALEAQGATVLNLYPSQPDRAFFNAIVEFDAAQIDAAAQINTVLWLGYSSTAPTLDAEMSAQIVAGNHPGGVPVTGYQQHLADLGYDGSGVTWAVIDTGVDYDHPDLNTRIVGGYTFPGACNTNAGDDCAGGGHGTHVAGIIGGDATAGIADGDGFLYGLGMAPNYGIFAMNSLSASAWPPAGGWQEHSKQAVLGGAIGGNNSWTTGEGTQHGYQASERTHDIMVRDGNFDTPAVAEPFIEVFSAGNSGVSGLTAPKEAKNLIVTASSQNFRAGDIDTVSGFSSRGPAEDGRWVPTVTAPGESIISTRNDLGGSCGTPISDPNDPNDYYASCSGTSMAAPHVSGAVVLTTEWWRTFNSGADPSPAMARALLVNHAVDMGVADIPNVDEGWGRINVTSVISSEVAMIYRDQLDLFQNSGEQFVLNVGLADPTQPLRITLAWSDAPGAVGANPALVNDLDLTVVNGGDTYLGNVFSGGWSATGGAADVVNNLENVYIESPGGSISIVVDAVNIAGDGVPYNGDTTDQDFVLVCQNCSLFPDFTLTAQPSSQAICTPADAVFTVSVGQVLGYSDPVTLSASGEPAGTTVSFSANPVTPSTPAMTSTLTIGNTGAATAGSYSIDVVGVAPTSTHTTTVGLDLYTTVPGTPLPQTPADGATNQPTETVFTWTAPAQGATYAIEIATDSGFTNIVETAAGLSATTYTASGLNSNTVYYWRVSSSNACGAGTAGATRSFTTEPLPGDCTLGSVPLTVAAEGFESGAAGWSSGGLGDTWALSGASTHGGSFAFHATDPAALSDQVLYSPAYVLPGAAYGPITLQFWNEQIIEDSSAGCYDGAQLAVSTDGGTTWTQVTDSQLLTDPYDGLIDGGFSNPAAGEEAWCGDPQAWLNSIVDLDDYAGETVQFRFRLASDSSVSREGWYIDDLEIQACAPGDLQYQYLPLILKP